MRDINPTILMKANQGTIGQLLTGVVIAGMRVHTGWTGITDGKFTVSIDGTPRAIVVDFSTATSMADVASLIQAGIRTITSGSETCTYDDTTFQFTIKSGTHGTSSAVSVLSTTGTGTDISGANHLNGAVGAGTATAGIGGLSLTFPCANYKDIAFAFSASGTGGATVKCKGCIKKDVANVDFSKAQSPTNQWEYVHLTPIDTTTGVDGNTGVALTNTDCRIFEVDTNILTHICFDITTITGEVFATIEVLGGAISAN